MGDDDGLPWINGSSCAFFRPLALAPEISRLGRMIIARGKPRGTWWHHHPEYEIHYLADGILEWSLDRKAPILLRPGDIYITRPDQEHSNYDVVIHRSTLFWIGLNPGLPLFPGIDANSRERWSQLLRECSGRVFKGEASIREHFDTLIDECVSPRDESEVMIRASMLQVVAAVFRSFAQRDRSTPGPSQGAKITDAIALMQQSLHRPLSISAIAAKVGVSRSGLHAEFVSDMGMSPNEFYLHLRIQKAKTLLGEWQTLADIAKALGFSSAQHLGAVFKRATGTTPGRWRESLESAPRQPDKSWS